MQLITNIDVIDKLDLPLAIKTKLKLHLIEPFNDDATQAQDFWDESVTSLLLFEASDDDATVNDQSEFIQHQITTICECPDEAIKIESDGVAVLVALAIINDLGTGWYLCVPMTGKTSLTQQLVNQL